jgi:CBS domain-containing protein
MHDNKFLTLPVCEDNGSVVGLVNVMDVIYGCGGADGWRSIFSTTLDLDDLSDTASHSSGRSNTLDGIAAGQSKSSVNTAKSSKTVMNLRPNKPVISLVDDSILDVTKNLATNRRDAAILVDTSGQLKGILTDTDITKRVVAKGVDVTETSASDVMTPNPKCVDQNGSAMEAMILMIENRFRHIPVVNQQKVVGTLDIAKCLNDAISKLERSASGKPSAAEKMMKEALESSGADAAALEALLYPLISKTFGAGSEIPLLRSITSESSCAIVSPETSVLDAAAVMAEKEKAALIVEEGEVVGIFGFKDMMTRVVAKELDQSSTPVSVVMTPDPECVEPDMTVVEALKMMHDNKFLTLPVCEENGSIAGIVDVMDLIHACGGAEHWRSIFEAALQVDDGSVNESFHTPAVKTDVPMIQITKDTPMASSPLHLPPNIPSTLEFRKGLNEDFDETTLNDTFRIESGSFLSDGNTITFKIVDPDGHTHRLRSGTKIVSLRDGLQEKLKGRANVKNLSLKFFDEEGDAILISTDDDLAEAVSLARNASQGSKFVVKLVADIDKGKSDMPDPMILAGVGVAVVVIALGALGVFSSKQTASRY